MQASGLLGAVYVIDNSSTCTTHVRLSITAGKMHIFCSRFKRKEVTMTNNNQDVEDSFRYSWLKYA